MVQEKQPDYLYHYTTVERLALILSNKTFRFSPLDKMDDLQEQDVADIKGLARLCYVSSWTEMDKESLPMWKEYTTPEAGVRIKMQRQPFRTSDIDIYEVAKIWKEKTGQETGACVGENAMVFHSAIPFAEMMRNDFYSPNVTDADNLLKRVIYTDDSEKLNPKLISPTATGGMKIDLSLLGTCKSTSWNFQEEWRYLFNACPYGLLTCAPEHAEQLMTRYVAESILNTIAQPFPWYDMALADDAFSKMEVTLSPQISDGNRMVTKTLLEKYNPSAKVSESSLHGLIR